VIDIFVQRRRNARAAKRFFAKALKGNCDAPNQLTTDKLSSYPPAIREVMLKRYTTQASTRIIGPNSHTN